MRPARAAPLPLACLHAACGRASSSLPSSVSALLPASPATLPTPSGEPCGSARSFRQALVLSTLLPASPATLPTPSGEPCRSPHPFRRALPLSTPLPASPAALPGSL
eukprot:64781-Chlamydomonas_euryale.AAC.5